MKCGFYVETLLTRGFHEVVAFVSDFTPEREFAGRFHLGSVSSLASYRLHL